MIIGNGLMAKKFAAYSASDSVLIFASGVSDSKETNLSEFEREASLLRKTLLGVDPNVLVVYFSTCSLYDPSENESSYVRHKLAMENLIARTVKKYLLLRLSQVAGNTSNKNTIVAYLVDAIRNEREFPLWQYAERNIIDIDDVFTVAQALIDRGGAENRVINIANRESISVPDMVHCIEQFLGKKARYQLVERGSAYAIEIAEIEPLLRETGIQFGKGYFQVVLKKYF
jgi:nucleoside-diphosphate-sugar epimerase